MPGESRDDFCNEWLPEAYESIADGAFDLIIAVGTRSVATGDAVTDSKREVLKTLTKPAPVLAIRDLPWFEENPIDCYAAGNDCAWPLFDFISEVDPTKTITIDDVAWVDMNDLVCPEGICQPVIGKRFVFRDSNHLTKSYVDSIADAVASRWAVAIDDLLR